MHKNEKCPCGSGRKFRYCHGKSKKMPSPGNILSIKIDKKSEKIIIASKDMLINQIHRDGPKIAKSFDQIIKNDINEISEIFSNSSLLISNHLSINSDDFKSTCAGLLSSCLTTFIASIEVARHGIRVPYGTLARQIIETLCTILDLATNENSLSDFHDGKLKSTMSVTRAKKFIPNIGEIYGMYSNEFTHINRNHSRFQPLSPYRKGDPELDFILPSIKANSWMIYVISELVFHSDVQSPRYWEYNGENGYSFAPTDEEVAWAENFLGAKQETQETKQPTPRPRTE